MIVLVLGSPGGGKTRKAVMLAKARFDAGWTVISNIHLNFPYTRLRDVDLSDERELSNTVMLLDEVHTIVDSRRSAKDANLDWSYLFLQARKMTVDIVATSQFIGQPDSRLRDVLDLVMQAVATAWEYINGVPRATEFDYTTIRPDGLSVTEHEVRGQEVLLYDTHEIVKKGKDSFNAPKPKDDTPKKSKRIKIDKRAQRAKDISKVL